jgi:transposase-like protein
MAIVYWQGIQQFMCYTKRGFQLDGTFIENGVGGILLVACFKDGNNNTRIVGIAIVSGENKNNWTCFMSFLHEHLCKIPIFIILDREKGLINAVKTVFGPEMHHAYCFRHVKENFNARFKSKDLKGMAWKIAKETTNEEFED